MDESRLLPLHSGTVFSKYGRYLTSFNPFDLNISCDRPCLELQNASLSFDIDCFLVKLWPPESSLANFSFSIHVRHCSLKAFRILRNVAQLFSKIIKVSSFRG